MDFLYNKYNSIPVKPAFIVDRESRRRRHEKRAPLFQGRRLIAKTHEKHRQNDG